MRGGRVEMGGGRELMGGEEKRVGESLRGMRVEYKEGGCGKMVNGVWVYGDGWRGEREVHVHV